MIQTQIPVQKSPDAILTADWHLREDVPPCRTDDFEKAQWSKVDFVKQLQKRYYCPVLHAGDLFHHWKSSPLLLTKTIEHIPDMFYTVLGQHDIPEHNLTLAFKSGVRTLERANKLTVLEGCHFGQSPSDQSSFIFKGRSILVWHHLTYQSKPFPEASGGLASGLLRRYTSYDLILTGDNHIPFTEQYEGRLLVNAGSLTRQTAAQIDHTPRVYLWYADSNEVVPVFLPIQEGVVSREHIEVVKERNERIDAFIAKLDGDWKAEMSFEDNLKIFFDQHRIRSSVKQLIYKVISL